MINYIITGILMILVAAVTVLVVQSLQSQSVAGLIEKQKREKQRNLELILGLFEKHETLTNAIIRQELGFDDRVVVNYMDELEKLGKVRQMGKTGMDAHYELVR